MAAEYKPISQLPSADNVNDGDMFLVSIFDNGRHTYRSVGMKWKDVKNRFVDQIGNRVDDWLAIPRLSADKVKIGTLSVDRVQFGQGALSG